MRIHSVGTALACWAGIAITISAAAQRLDSVSLASNTVPMYTPIAVTYAFAPIAFPSPITVTGYLVNPAGTQTKVFSKKPFTPSPR